MWRLWRRMTEIYGHKFTSNFGDQPNESWSRCLSDVSPMKIGAGLNELLTRADPWPPTAIEFRQLCLGMLDDVANQQRRQAAEPSLALPYRPDKDLGRQKLAEIKAMLA